MEFETVQQAHRMVEPGPGGGRPDEPAPVPEPGRTPQPGPAGPRTPYPVDDPGIADPGRLPGSEPDIPGPTGPGTHF